MKHLQTLIIVIIVASLTSCAKIGSPTGGPKDSIPPVMAIAKPLNKSTSFNQKKITIYFDEYIKFKNLASQLIISPPIEKKPIIKPESDVAKKISIEFLDDLTPNTTYTINFGNSIIDHNEGNALGQFSYVFSTGSYIDSLAISGKTLDPLDTKPLENISILAYKNANDTLVGRHIPNYLTNTLNNEAFSLENLSEGSYQLIALEDINHNYKYDRGFEKIGFLNKPIGLSSSVDSIQFTLFQESKDNKIFNPTQAKGNQIIIGYQGEDTPNVEISGINKNDFLISQDLDKDSIYIWLKDIPKDSIKIQARLDKIHKTFTIKPRVLEKDSLTIKNLTKQILHPSDSVSISANIPITEIYRDSIILLENDSIPTLFDVYNSTKKQKITINFKRKKATTYSLILKKGAFQDYLNNLNHLETIKFRTLIDEEYGELNLNITNSKKYSLVIELINHKTKKVISKNAIDSQIVSFKNIEPGEYFIRIIKDLNKNYKYDSGNFKNREQPEVIINFKDNTLLKIRANSEIIENISIE